LRRLNAEFVKVAVFVSAGFKPMAKPRAATTPKDYESALAELEAIVAEMESGQLPLEASLAAYKRGAELLQYCRQQLLDAEQQVSILENGAVLPFKAAQPFKTDDTDD
jgi:exodeoxyribonuclease VII small subunit